MREKQIKEIRESAIIRYLAETTKSFRDVLKVTRTDEFKENFKVTIIDECKTPNVDRQTLLVRAMSFIADQMRKCHF